MLRLGTEDVSRCELVAEAHGKVFPPGEIATLCGYFFERMSKFEDVMVWSEGRQSYEHAEVRLWLQDVNMPAAYLVRCCGNLEQPEQVQKVLDNYEIRERRALVSREKDERAAYEGLCEALEGLRKHPNDPEYRELWENRSRKSPEVAERLFAVDDWKHGGDGAGSSWKNPTRKNVRAEIPAIVAAALEKNGGRSEADTIWELTKRELKSKLSLDSYLNWIHMTRGARVEDGRLVITVPNPETREWIENEYSAMVSEILHEVAAALSGVVYELAAHNGKPPRDGRDGMGTPAKTMTSGGPSP